MDCESVSGTGPAAGRKFGFDGLFRRYVDRQVCTADGDSPLPHGNRVTAPINLCLTPAYTPASNDNGTGKTDRRLWGQMTGEVTD